MTGLLLSALPLKLGYATTIPGFADGTIDATPIRVTRSEMIKAGDLGSVKTWVGEAGAAPAPSTCWISKSAPYVIRAVVRTPNALAAWRWVGIGKSRLQASKCT
ncbi:hypothetical protein FPZ24_02065 [Sphingomonas panacisoli]|uniref:Uncharacterized protein n=1 Tax=Sphingomonas panacisoli TaxID=1813879 RepID=A0A5B8LDZ7_9SPHN|nr:hypothetical protein [Sphingomonas panacisoli]QDZ06408.1 hypothetical protein FPZ24_02065 [Sphingomonas panacisoli]